jgi:hypothetical protein
MMIFFTFSCKDDPQYIEIDIKDNPQEIYDLIWEDFNVNYPAFEINNIDWDSVYSVDYGRLSDTSSDKELFDVINSSVLSLKDAHSDIISEQYGATDYYSIYTRNKPTNYISWLTIGTKYIDVYENNYISIAYGKIKNEDIGYYFVADFWNNDNDYNLFTTFLTRFKDSKGLIIDLRQNGGGNSNNGKIIATSLANQSYTYMYERFNDGNSGLNDFISFTIEPSGEIRYTNKVILLTNRRTFSAAENVTLMLKALPNIIHIGDTTFGGVASNIILKELPNGWNYRMPTSIEYDINKTPIKGGIAPDISIWISKTDSLNGKDIILEKAIEIINE